MMLESPVTIRQWRRRVLELRSLYDEADRLNHQIAEDTQRIIVAIDQINEDMDAIWQELKNSGDPADDEADGLAQTWKQDAVAQLRQLADDFPHGRKLFEKASQLVQRDREHWIGADAADAAEEFLERARRLFPAASDRIAQVRDALRKWRN
jgi:hypothetical protein